MGATLLLLCADFSAVAGGRRRPSLPSGPRLAAPAAGSRAPPSRASVRPSAAAAPLAARGLPHHASVAGTTEGGCDHLGDQLAIWSSGSGTIAHSLLHQDS
uniref:Uncharacterized protein n=1 Tax=Oryza meridionalis TaxID=40149 RepID=A0A0E0EK48_9ORYZ